MQVLIRRKDGAKVLVDRTFGTEHFRVTFENDRVEQFGAPDSLHFSSYILGWHEIEQAATDPKIRKIYLDTIAGREAIRKFTEDADIAAKRIRSLHEQTAAKYAQFKSVHDKIVRLEELRKGLQELDDSKLIELQQKYESALRHQDLIKNTLKKITELSDETNVRASSLKIQLDADSVQGDLLRLKITSLQRLHRLIGGHERNYPSIRKSAFGGLT